MKKSPERIQAEKDFPISAKWDEPVTLVHRTGISTTVLSQRTGKVLEVIPHKQGA